MVYPYNEENTFINWDFENIWSHDNGLANNNGNPYLK
jgi:hypothetical protein